VTGVQTCALPIFNAAEQAKPQATPQAGTTDGAFELAYWDSIKSSTNAADFKAYLEQFPKGRFAALARNRLGTLEPQVAAARATTLGTTSALRDLPKVGDTWTYNMFDRGRKADTLTVSIAGVSPEGRITEKLARGKFPNFSANRTFEPEFNPRAYQEIETPGQMYLPEFSPYIAPDASMICKNWDDLTPSLVAGMSDTRREVWSMKMQVLGSERIRVPAGEFMTIKVEGVTDTHVYQGRGGGSLRLTYWYAPQVKRTIRITRELRGFATNGGQRGQEDIYELANYKLKE
jgi:hypothetical protein